MGASSSGLLDEAKINHITGLVDLTFLSFSVFYRQQYSSTYVRHLHQEVEPKKEGRGLLLTQRPQYGPEEVLYQDSVKFSCWDEPGKKYRERYIVLRRNYKVEIHDNKETFSRGCAAKLVLQPTGGTVLTSGEESRAHLDKICDAILNGVKKDSSSLVLSPDVFAAYLHLPYTGHAHFVFQQEEERDHFLSALKTCIRHRNLDPWVNSSSYESQAYIRALRLYRQDRGCYESWEMLLGTEEEVLASQVMEEVLPWLQTQLPSRVKGKKAERIRLWLATVHATYTLVLQQLTGSLEALRAECRQTASANQALIRSNLDQIVSSLSFLEQKVRVCVCEEAQSVYGECVAPHLSSVLEVLTENISAGIQGMRHTLHTHMDSDFTHTNGGTEDTKKALSSLSSLRVDQSCVSMKNVSETLGELNQRFGLSSLGRLLHSAHLEMEQLLDNAVYTLKLFLQSSARLQPSQVPVKMERAKERVLKQLDYDSRVVQRRLFVEALLEITLPALTRRMDTKWKSELQQFDQYIFADYSSFILVRNVYDDVLRNSLSAQLDTVLQEAASKKSNSVLLDMCDMALSQYSLLGPSPPCSAPGSPPTTARDLSSAGAETQSVPEAGEGERVASHPAAAGSDPRPSEPSVSAPGPLEVDERVKVQPAVGSEPMSSPSPEPSTSALPPGVVNEEEGKGVASQPQSDVGTGSEPNSESSEPSMLPPPPQAEEGERVVTQPQSDATPQSDPKSPEPSVLPSSPAEEEEVKVASQLQSDAGAGSEPSSESSEPSMLPLPPQGEEDEEVASQPQTEADTECDPSPEPCISPLSPGLVEEKEEGDGVASQSLSDSVAESDTGSNQTSALSLSPLSPGLMEPEEEKEGERVISQPLGDSAAGSEPNSDQGSEPTSTSALPPSAEENEEVTAQSQSDGSHSQPSQSPEPNVLLLSESLAEEKEEGEGVASLTLSDSADESETSSNQSSVLSLSPLSPGLMRKEEVEEGEGVKSRPQSYAAAGSHPNSNRSSEPILSPPVVVVTQLFDEPTRKEVSEEIHEDLQPGTHNPAPDPAAPSEQTPGCAVDVIQPSTDSPTKLTLESLNEAISCSTTLNQAAAQTMTDRAVYLTGEIKENWEVEREKKKEAESEEKRGGAEEGIGEQEEEPQPMETQQESSAEPPLDGVAAIRELVTEIIEVETVVSPCPHGTEDTP